MTRIRILPDILANKIAAGEVVERPAAVVKELVENALDAGGERIAIEIENGGRALIQVADNGSGMGYDDALLALERFATSKLRSDADLAAIRTLGFRGEALPSIAAVSKLTLITREQESDTGVQIQVEDGRILHVTETGAPRGTLVRVARLFYNTPARRKFLKTVNTEMAHIADTVAGMALGRPDVHFTLTHNGKTVQQWPRAADGAERAAGVLGRAEGEALLPLAAASEPFRLNGWIAPPRLARNTPRGTFLFVNGRRVRDRIIQHALFEGFEGRLMKGRHPLSVLLLHVPWDQVDVNVHPTKHEVRFVDPRRVHDLVRDGVRDALERSERRRWHPDTIAKPVADTRPAPPAGRTDIRHAAPASVPPAAAVAESPIAYGPVPTTPADGVPATDSPAPASPRDPYRPPAPAAAPREATASNRPAAAKPTQQALWHADRFADLVVIGQYRGTYILCQQGDDLILIDQHAAHERVVFEALARQHHAPEAQRLLMPETVELGFAEARALEPMATHLSAMGLEIEPFGGTTFAIKTIPSLLADADPADLVRGLAERCAELGLDTDPQKILDACRMVMACHRAVRANQHLNDTQIRRLLEDLDRCQNPSHCPHGRPTWVRWTLRDVEKAFGRRA